MKPNISKLKNNLRLVTIPIRTSLTATVMILVKVGSRYEDEKHGGLAHFVEHMFFKGTSKRPTSKHIGMDIEKLGGSSNAFTSHDYTGYYIKVPKENINGAIEIICDMIKNGLFEQKEIDKERGVIVEEIRMYEDRPMSKVNDLWSSEFFGNTPLGRDVAGKIETVNSFKRSDFTKFVKNNYTGENVVVVLSGGINEDDVKDVIKKSLNDLNKGKENKFKKYVRDTKTARVVNLYKPLEQSHLMLGGYSVKRDYENRNVLKVAQAFLSQGFGSRLFQVIRDELGLAYYVYSRMQNFNDIGTFTIGLGVENTKIHLAIKAVMKELKKILAGEIDEDEVVRAKNFLLGNLVTDMENSDDIALWFGLKELLLNRFDTIEEMKREIKNVKTNDIIEEMNKMLSGQQLLLAGVTPHKKLDQNMVGDIIL